MKTKKHWLGVGRVIRKYRHLHGMSQRALADFLGYTSPQFISNWERGMSSPPLDTLGKLARKLNIPFSTFSDLLIEAKENEIWETFNKYQDS